MGDTASRQGQLLVAVVIILAFVSIALAPTLITDKDYWKPFSFVFMFFCCVHLVLGSDHARGFIAVYLMMFGTLRVLAFVFVLVTGGPVSRNSVSLFGAIFGLVAAGILAFSKPLRDFLRLRYEARNRRHAILIRALWIVFLVYCAVLAYFDLTITT